MRLLDRSVYTCFNLLYFFHKHVFMHTASSIYVQAASDGFGRLLSHFCGPLASVLCNSDVDFFEHTIALV